MKSKYSTTLCLLCGAYIAKGVEIRKVGGAWVHGRCPRRHYITMISAQAKASPRRASQCRKPDKAKTDAVRRGDRRQDRDQVRVRQGDL